MLTLDKITYIKENGKVTKSTYLPEPGIPVDMKLEKGDYVFIDIKLSINKTDKKSINVSPSMLAYNKKWLRIESNCGYSQKYNSYRYNLEGVHFAWFWYHFGAVRKKDYEENVFIKNKLPVI